MSAACFVPECGAPAVAFGACDLHRQAERVEALLIAAGDPVDDELRRIDRDHEAREQAREEARRNLPPLTGQATRYGEAALRQIIGGVLSAGEGLRNATLNRAAYAVGQLVAGNQIDESPGVEAITAAGCEIGLPRFEVASTVRSGMRAGMQNPRYPKAAP